MSTVLSTAETRICRLTKSHWFGVFFEIFPQRKREPSLELGGTEEDGRLSLLVERKKADIKCEARDSSIRIIFRKIMKLKATFIACKEHRCANNITECTSLQICPYSVYGRLQNLYEAVTISYLFSNGQSCEVGHTLII
jgi:hypothetical protein